MTPPRRLPPDFSVNAGYPLFAFDVADDRGWVLHFEPDDYRRASFLDQRALHHRQIPGWEVSRAELEAALDGPMPAAPVVRPVHWLFHIGHCGSTLLSRILDLAPGVLGLREPLPLLALAQAPDGAAAAWFAPTLRLLARGFDDTHAVVVKPTSVVTTLAPLLLDGHAGQACLLWVDLQTWLATLLRDPSLRENTLSAEPLRMASLAAALPSTAGDGERLARLWLVEQLRWRRLAADPQTGPRLLDLDFATLLDDPAATSARLLTHFGLQASPDWAQRIEASGLLTRYAKDEAQQFDALTRQRELAASEALHHDAIAAAVAWAERAIALTGAGDLFPRLRP